MIRRYFYLFFLSLCLGSCSNQQSTHWILRTELQPAPEPNIKSIELSDGSILEFDQSLGWYDAGKQIIEGVTLTGWHPTIPLSKVERVEIQDEDSSTGNTVMKGIGIALLIYLGLGIVAGIVLLNQISSHGGCVVFIAVVGITTTAAAILIFA
jgi:hypothetical protein